MTFTVQIVNLARKMLGADGEHRSRWHTRRGQFVTAGMFASALRRGRVSHRPWMVDSAVDELAGLLNPKMRMLELGSGSSTAWYAERTGSVVSIEPDPGWAAEVRRRVGTRKNVELRETSVQDALVRVESFDVAIVDHIDEVGHSRSASVLALRDVASIIVLDDSDRATYAEVESYLHGWQKHRHVGFRPKPLRATETSIYLRPT